MSNATRQDMLNAIEKDTVVKSSMSLEDTLAELKHKVSELETKMHEEKFLEHAAKLTNLFKDYKYVVYGNNVPEIINLGYRLKEERADIGFDHITGLLTLSNRDKGSTFTKYGTLIKEPGDHFHKAHLLAEAIKNIGSDVSKTSNTTNLDDILNIVNEVSWRYEEMFKELKGGS